MNKINSFMMIILILIFFQIYLLNGLNELNEFSSDGINFWNSTTDFIPIKNTSYGTIKLKTAFYMKFDIIFHGKTINAKWENIFRIGHAGYSQNDFKCSKNDRFPALWIDDDSNAFVFDISDKTNCFRQYANFIITQHTFYSIIIQYNSSWVYIEINNNIITNQPRIDSTDIDKLGTDVQIWISTVTSIPANVTLSNIMILSYDDDSFTNKPTIYPTNQPSMSPTSTSFPTLNPSLHPTTNPISTKKPTTFFPTIYIPYTSTMEEEKEESTTTTTTKTTTTSLFDISTTDILLPFSTEQEQETDDNISSTMSSTLKTNINNILTAYIDNHMNGTVISSDSNNNKQNGLSFEIIFYILTGCAMGGILFCVCACCCFGCIINKKMKTLASNDEKDEDDNNRKDESVSNILSISNVFYRSNNREKERIQTMSGDSNKQTPQPMIEEEVSKLFNIAATSPSNRLTSPSSVMTIKSTASSTCSSDTTSSSTTTTTTTSLSSNGRTETTKTASNKIIDLTQNHKRYYTKHNRKQKSFKKLTKSVPIMDANTSRDKKIKLQRKHKRNEDITRDNRKDIALAMEFADTLETNEEETETEHSEHSEHRDDAKDENEDNKDKIGNVFECDREESIDNSISITVSQTCTTSNRQQLAPNSNNNTIISNPSTTHYSLFVHKPSSPNDLEEEEEDTDNEETKGNEMSETTEESRTKHQRQSSNNKHYQIQIDYAKTNTISSIHNEENKNDEIEIEDEIIITTKSQNTPKGEDDIDIDGIDINSIHEMIEFDHEYYDHDIKTIDDELDTLNQKQTDDSSTNDEEDEDMKEDEEEIYVTKNIDDAIDEIEQEENDKNKINNKQQDDDRNKSETAKTFLELPVTGDSGSDSNLSAASNGSSSSSSSSIASTASSSSSSVASTASSTSSQSSNSTSTSTTSKSSRSGYYPVQYTKNNGYYRNSSQSQF